MDRKTAGSDNRLYDLLIDLKRHLATCKDCKASVKCDDPYMMCKTGITMVMQSAKFYDLIIKLRVKSSNSGSVTCFPCPSLRAHGKSFELTALPVYVTGIQDRMI